LLSILSQACVISEADSLTSYTSQILLPYLRLKAHDLFLTLGGLSDTSILGPSPSSTSAASPDDRPPARPSLKAHIAALMKRLFVRLYPWLSLTWELSTLGWNVAYLFEKTRFWGVEGWVLRLVMGRVERDDLASLSS
jgi:hypothetical protein